MFVRFCPEPITRQNQHEITQLTIAIEIDHSVTELHRNDFVDTNELRYVMFADQSSLRRIHHRTFYRHYNLQSIMLPEGLVRIEMEAFAYSRPSRIVLPSTLRYIGVKAFYEVGHLSTQINLPSGITHIGSRAFAGTFTSAQPLPTAIVTIGRLIFGINHSIFDQVVTLLPQPTCQLKKVDLSKDINVSTTDHHRQLFDNLIAALKINATLEVLKLCDIGLTDEHATTLVQTLPYCPTLRELELNQNSINTDLRWLRDCLTLSSNICELHIDAPRENTPGAYDYDSILSFLEKNFQLTHINKPLKCAPQQDNRAHRIQHLLQVNGYGRILFHRTPNIPMISPSVWPHLIDNTNCIICYEPEDRSEADAKEHCNVIFYLLCESIELLIDYFATQKPMPS